MSDVLMGIAIGVIGSIIASLLLTIFRVQDRVQGWLDRRALSNKNKRLEQLQQEYEQVKELHDNPTFLNLDMGRLTIASLALVCLLIAILLLVEYVLFFVVDNSNSINRWTFHLLFTGFAGGSIGVAFYFSNRLIKFGEDLIRLRNFEQYEQKVKARIAELEKGKAKEGD